MYRSIAKIVPILILLITISSINQWSKLPLGSTTFWWFIYAFILFYFVQAKRLLKPEYLRLQPLFLFYLYLGWTILASVRGVFVASDYWEWKQLVSTTMFFLMPLSIYIVLNATLLQSVLSTWVKFALPGFIFFLFFLYGEAVGRYLIPISFLLLFFPAINGKWKVLVLFLTIFVLLYDLTARSNVIKFGIPAILAMVFYLGFFKNKILSETLRLLLMFSPIILFYLALTGVFNVFKISEYVTKDITVEHIGESGVREENLLGDTRTGLYLEVIRSAIKYEYVLFGRTPARGNESFIFGRQIDEATGRNKMERHSNEASILNVFTWTGLVGIALYFLVFFWASYLAVHRSNNEYMRLIGVYVAFRWLYAWVEDFSRFDLSFLLLWVMIGMCYSTVFRDMTNDEVKNWVRGIFNKPVLIRRTLVSGTKNKDV